jgi:DNA (cytosine-5)-methyltransferase 1
MLTAVDLFCGAGGMTAGLSKAGFDIIGAVDYWKPAIRTYCQNFNYPAILADIRAISDKEFRSFLGLSSRQVDLLVGGPPCQGFSTRRDDGYKDDRTELIFEFARRVKSLHPRMFLMECKTGILNRQNKELKAHLEAMFLNSGYTVRSQIVNAAEYGVPQIRKRLFYYGWLKGEVHEFSFPHPDHGPESFRTVEDTIGDLPSLSIDWTASSNVPQHYLIRTLEVNLERLRHIPPGGGVEDLPDYLKPTHYQYSRYKSGHHGAYGRLHPDRPSAAIIDGFDSFTRGRFGHPYENRNITLREGARLQTFPDKFLFEGSQREVTALIGNATPPLLSEKIAYAIAGHLRGDSKFHSASLPLIASPAVKGKSFLKKAVQPCFKFEAENTARDKKRVALPLSLHDVRFHSCFISYSSKDLELAQRIYVDLKAKGVHCWFAPEDLKIGERYRVRIDDEIRAYDKLLLVLSKSSVSSTWVEKEVNTALEREAEQGHTMLFPVRLDNAVMEVKSGWAADIRRSRHIGDFTNWENKHSYRRAFERLLRDLKVEHNFNITASHTPQYTSL